MNLILNTIRRFLVNHSVWMHFTLILLLSYFMIQISHLTLAKVYYLWVLGMIVFSIPALVFIVFRDLKPSPKDSKYWTIWGLTFIAYPTVLFLLGVDIISLSFSDQLVKWDINGAYTFFTLSMLFLILELALFWLNSKPENATKQFRFKNLSVLKIAIVAVTCFCIFAMLANNYFYIEIEEDSGFMKIAKFIIYFIQLFIIYLSYYMYYYIHHKILYRNVLKERGLIPYLMGLGLTIILLVPIQNWLISFFPVVQNLILHPTGVIELFNDLNFGLATTVLIITFPMIVIIEWYKQVNLVAKLEEQKLKTELSLLKQQINPHFFFNTLNNLYSMSLSEDKETPETILQLSEMMRYVIYKGKEEKVKLSDEVKYMRDYIKLQMIRMHKEVDLKIEFDIENDDLSISPLMFIILLENAFKHGIEPAGSKSMLHIKMSDGDGTVTFECYNSKPEESLIGENGIGLSNLKKRLEIVYPNQYELVIDDRNDSYKAILKINL